MEMNGDQVRSILRYIEHSQPESVKRDIFSRLGHECFIARNVGAWIESFQGNVRAFIDRVNVEKKSPYWERLEFNEDRSVLYLTGKPVDGCVCAFGGEQAPVSLCDHCCTTFQEDIWSALFGCEVEVEITASSLHGDERCNTAIRLGARPPADPFPVTRP